MNMLELTPPGPFTYTSISFAVFALIYFAVAKKPDKLKFDYNVRDNQFPFYFFSYALNLVLSIIISLALFFGIGGLLSLADIKTESHDFLYILFFVNVVLIYIMNYKTIARRDLTSCELSYDDLRQSVWGSSTIPTDNQWRQLFRDVDKAAKEYNIPDGATAPKYNYLEAKILGVIIFIAVLSVMIFIAISG